MSSCGSTVLPITTRWTINIRLGGIFCLLLGILFSLILIHLLLLRSYEEKNKTRYAAIAFASAKEKAATPILSKKEKQ